MALAPQAIGVLLLICFSVFAQDWPYPGRDAGGTRHSELKQINRTNVAKLTVAWTFDTEDGATTSTCPRARTRSDHPCRA